MTTTVTGAYPKISDDSAGQELRRALHRFDRGEIEHDALDRVFDDRSERAVREMEAAGIDVPNHGEVRWDDLFAPFVRVWRNVSREALERFFDSNTYFRVPKVNGQISVDDVATVREYDVARKAASRRVKASICGPLTFARLAEDRHYGSRRALALAVAAALREELLALQAAGCDLIDVEEPALVRWPEELAHAGEVYAELTRGVEASLALQLPLFAADAIVDRLSDLPFAQVGVDLRSRPTRVLERLAALRQTVVLGVVDARSTRLESADAIARELDAAARLLSPERLWLAPTSSLEYLPHEVAVAKLNVLVEGARTLLAAGGAR